MTEIETAVTPVPAATPLAGLIASMIASSGPERELGVYLGVLTPLQLDAAEKETAALVSGAAVHDLGWMRRVAVRGEDRFRWLSGMVSNMVNDLAANAGAWNLVLNAQGRIQGDLWAWRDGEDLEMEIAADQYDKLLAHLNRFIIMDDVELGAIEDVTAIGLTGAKAGEVLASAGLPALNEALTQTTATWNGFEIRIRRSYGVLAEHYELWASEAAMAPLWQALSEAGAVAVGTRSLDAFRIAEGIPLYGVDIAERDLAQETSQMRALHFTKGCYLGQEIVERIRSRGSVHRHLRQLAIEGPVPAAGTELYPIGADAEIAKAAGHITSAAELPAAAGRRVLALGMMRAEAEVGEQTFTFNAGSTAGTARVLSSPPHLS